MDLRQETAEDSDTGIREFKLDSAVTVGIAFRRSGELHGGVSEKGSGEA